MRKTKSPFKQLALIGSTASGKTSLSIALAHKMDASILSIDSLAVYKEIDVVSAKPTIEESEGVEHFGIDLLYPNETFDVSLFIQLYQEVYQHCLHEGKNLIIVGGTSFYLKMLLEGMSSLPPIQESTKQESKLHLNTLEKTYRWLYSLDPEYLQKIKPNDRYRIEKVLHLYLQTQLTPTDYFAKFPPQPTIKQPLPLYQIVWERERLRDRIALRTQQMLETGLIDEVCRLEKQYTRSPNSMKSIGIKETLSYLDGYYDRDTLKQKIITNTARLAKRQNTFNNSQFDTLHKGSLETLKTLLL